MAEAFALPSGFPLSRISLQSIDAGFERQYHLGPAKQLSRGSDLFAGDHARSFRRSTRNNPGACVGQPFLSLTSGRR
jgi:hypothetical protein